MDILLRLQDVLFLWIVANASGFGDDMGDMWNGLPRFLILIYCMIYLFMVLFFHPEEHQTKTEK